MWVFIAHFPRNFAGMQLCLAKKFLCLFHTLFCDIFNKCYLHFLTKYAAKIVAANAGSIQ